MSSRKIGYDRPARSYALLRIRPAFSIAFLDVVYGINLPIIQHDHCFLDLPYVMSGESTLFPFQRIDLSLDTLVGHFEASAQGYLL